MWGTNNDERSSEMELGYSPGIISIIKNQEKSKEWTPHVYDKLFSTKGRKITYIIKMRNNNIMKKFRNNKNKNIIKLQIK